MACQCISLGVIVNGFKKCMYPMQWMRLMICCGMAVKGMGMLGVRER